MATKRIANNLVDDETGEVLATEVTVAMPLWKTPYNHDRDAESARVALRCNDPSLTKQEFKDDSDINVILDRFLKTQEPPPMALPEHFTDLTGRTSYFEMASKIAEANQMFYRLPPDIRQEFANDPAQWADAVNTAIETDDGDRLLDLGVEAQIKTRAPQEPPQPPNPPAGTPAADLEKEPSKGSKKPPGGGKD